MQRHKNTSGVYSRAFNFLSSEDLKGRGYLDARVIRPVASWPVAWGTRRTRQPLVKAGTVRMLPELCYHDSNGGEDGSDFGSQP